MRSIEEIREEMLRSYGEKNLYQAIEHPAFSDWTCTQPCEERWELISSELDLRKRGTVLDVGCHAGWFCRAFSCVGWQAWGVDRDPIALELASDHLRAYEVSSYPVTYLLGDFRELELPKVDVVLCLSLAMYLFSTEEKEGWRSLHQLSTLAPIMFFDSGGMYQDRMPFAPEKAGEVLLDHTAYRYQRLLGKSALGRPLFLLSDE